MSRRHGSTHVHSYADSVFTRGKRFALSEVSHRNGVMLTCDSQLTHHLSVMGLTVFTHAPTVCEAHALIP